MSKLTKFILIILTIISFAIGLTYLFATFSKNYNPMQCICLSIIGFTLSYLINEDILKHEIAKEPEESETFF